MGSGIARQSRGRIEMPVTNSTYTTQASVKAGNFLEFYS